MGGIPPRHLTVAGGAEAHRFGGRKEPRAARTTGGQHHCEDVLADGVDSFKHDLIMTGNIFDTEQINRRAMAIGDAPVRDELNRRLVERLGEVRGKREAGVVVTYENFEAEAESLEAVAIDMVLPLVEDVPLFLVRCLRALRPDGLLLATALGVESFREFRAAWAEVGEPSGHVVPLTDVRDGGALLQRLKLALPVVDRDVLVVTFPDFEALYKSLRAHGVGNFAKNRRQGLVTLRRLKAMEEVYMRLFARSDGRVQVTLEVIYLHGFKQAEGQPTAAKRGSGKVSLVRIMGEDNN